MFSIDLRDNEIMLDVYFDYCMAHLEPRLHLHLASSTTPRSTSSMCRPHPETYNRLQMKITDHVWHFNYHILYFFTCWHATNTIIGFGLTCYKEQLERWKQKCSKCYKLRDLRDIWMIWPNGRMESITYKRHNNNKYNI